MYYLIYLLGRHKIQDSGHSNKLPEFESNLTKPNLSKPNLLITSKLLVFHAYLIHYFYNSKNKGKRPKRTSDSDSTSKNT